jgi:uncharacterized protein YdaU (DUF1376 family)
MNFYSFHVGDYAAHTKHLTPMEDLAYRRMLDLYYTSEKPLPAEPEKVARLIGLRDCLQEVSDVLSDFFVKSEEGHRSKRCDDEIAAYQAKAGRAKQANLARWGGEKSEPSLKSESRQIPTKNQEPRTNNQEPKEENTPRKRSATPALDRPDDVTEQTWSDWLALRKKKSAPVTQTVLDGAKCEAEKAGMPLEDFLRVWCLRGSQGLQADWLKPHERGAGKPSGQRYHHDLSTMDYTKGVSADGKF